MQATKTDTTPEDALKPGWFVDSEHPDVKAFADKTVGEATDPVEKARRLFYAVRDGFRYDPYQLSARPEDFQASAILKTDANWCVPKAVVLTAAARAAGIPARLGFADVKNHLTSKKLSASMGTDVFAWHGYSELWLNDHWVALSTAFNIELCDKFDTKPLEFDAQSGALMHAFDQSGNRHMEYVNQRGTYLDLPLDAMFETFAEIYPGWVKREDGSYGHGDATTDSHDEAFHD